MQNRVPEWWSLMYLEDGLRVDTVQATSVLQIRRDTQRKLLCPVAPDGQGRAGVTED